MTTRERFAQAAEELLIETEIDFLIMHTRESFGQFVKSDLFKSYKPHAKADAVHHYSLLLGFLSELKALHLTEEINQLEKTTAK